MTVEHELFRKAVGTRLKKLRKRHGGSRRELAELLGTYYGRVCNWENGRAAPNDAYMEALADHYGVTVEYLKTGKRAA